MKYIINIPKTVGMTEKVGSVHYTYFDGIQCNTIVLKSDEIEELNSEYVNEHFGDLQDEAYKRGMEDATRAGKLVCESCAIHGTRNCDYCCHNWESKYKSKQTDDILIDIIRNGIHNWVTELNVKLDDIASILEDMRNDES